MIFGSIWKSTFRGVLYQMHVFRPASPPLVVVQPLRWDPGRGFLANPWAPLLCPWWLTPETSAFPGVSIKSHKRSFLREDAALCPCGTVTARHTGVKPLPPCPGGSQRTRTEACLLIPGDLPVDLSSGAVQPAEEMFYLLLGWGSREAWVCGYLASPVQVLPS